MQDEPNKPKDTGSSFAISIAQIPVSTGICPQSGSRGRRVDSLTLKAMLAVSLSELRNTQYFFCKDANCSVVYFSEDGKQIFTTEILREAVYQKESENNEVFLCYCFRHTVGELRKDVLAGREESIIASINAAIKAGQCACDIRNPQGSCCLGNVQVFIKQLKETDKSQSIEAKDED